MARPGPAGAGSPPASRGCRWSAEAEALKAAAQAADPRSTLSLIRRLGALRRGTPALQLGAQRLLDAGADVLAWERERDGERLVAAVNFAAAPAALGLAPGELVVSSDPDRAGLEDGTLAAGEAVLFRPAP